MAKSRFTTTQVLWDTMNRGKSFAVRHLNPFMTADTGFDMSLLWA